MNNKKALVIGVDRYYNKSDELHFLEQLPSCKKDAKDLSRVLLNIGYKLYNEKPVIGSKLSAKFGWTQIRKLIHDFFEDANADQNLLFYFSGHGIFKNNEVYLATPQTNPDKPGAEGFALSLLKFQICSEI